MFTKALKAAGSVSSSHMVVLNYVHIFQFLHEVQEIGRKTEFLIKIPHTSLILENTQKHRVLRVEALQKFLFIKLFDILFLFLFYEKENTFVWPLK